MNIERYHTLYREGIDYGTLNVIIHYIE